MGTAGEAIFGSGRRLVIGTFLACALIATAATGASAQGVVPTDKGPVRGVETPTVNKYLGIPYAVPPVGELRWQPPQPLARWQTPRDATQFGNHCPQGPSPFGTESTTEDCLYLNVFTPNGKVAQEKNGKTKLKQAKRLPVMVWLHGGALVVGESDDYDPTRLVEKGAVVVTLNYRLGFLGFFAHPALSAESPNQSSGNYGLMDQQAALRWVQRNIKKFGGDRDNVTIFGESAGGLSVHAHLASPLSAGLFDRAIAQSGAYNPTEPTLTDAESSGLAFAHTMGCGEDQTEACLRSRPVETVLETQPELPGAIGPNRDGVVLPQTITSALDSGQFNRVPVIEGSNHDEFTIFGKLFIEDMFPPLPPSFYGLAIGLFTSTVGLHADPTAIQGLYPLGSQTIPQALSKIATDAIFACPARRTSQALSKFTPTFAYEFNDPTAPQRFVPPAHFPYGAYHAAEVQYLFDLPNPLNAPALNGDQRALADTMVRYWTQFARAGNPNTAGAPQWPAYTAANDLFMSLELPTPVAKAGFAADHKCEFWDAQS
jgi:para-nitrobenzyl esterase